MKEGHGDRGLARCFDSTHRSGQLSLACVRTTQRGDHSYAALLDHHPADRLCAVHAAATSSTRRKPIINADSEWNTTDKSTLKENRL